MKQLITFDNLLNAALLKFDGIVDNKDLAILIEMLKKENIFLEDCDSIINKLKKKGYESWGIYDLENFNGLSLEQIQVELENQQGITMKHFMENLDLNELILRKIFPRIFTHVVYHNYSNVLVKHIKLLNLNGFVDNLYWQGSTRIFNITYKGVAYLFIKDNPELINSFKDIIINQGLDVQYLNDFILDTYPKCKYNLNIIDYQKYCLQKITEEEMALTRKKKLSLSGSELPF
ncbi:MAG: hypothetical protein E7163_02625 [Firmicutes bacterium]|nr:hypothetical protein [Bacillota bacterium]